MTCFITGALIGVVVVLCLVGYLVHSATANMDHRGEEDRS